MQIKSLVLAALAGLTSASPVTSPNPEAQALAHLNARADCTPNGAIIFYSGNGYTNNGRDPLIIYAFQGQQAFCQRFDPVVKGGFSYASYVSGALLFVGYKSGDCSGNGIVIAKANGNQNSPNAGQSGLNSFQAVYLSN